LLDSLLQEKMGVLLVLTLCVGLSYQICHNGICDDDKCSSDSDCPNGYSCDTACGNCEAIPGYCSSHFMCSLYDGMCDVPSNPYTTCYFCDQNSHLCQPGCVDNNNCPAGYQCIGHQCVEDQTCTDNAYCNEGNTAPVCDVGHKPYTTCFYCEGGECLPGCLDSSNCPASYTCNNHICEASPGSVLINSITVKTKSCDGCDASNEGISLTLLGQQTVGFVDGLPCTASNLDHSAITDFAGGDARFGGAADEETMGGCYEAPLNGELREGGVLSWKGAGTWAPAEVRSVCVDWSSDTKFAWSCDATPYGDHWNLVNCHNLVPKTKCDQA